MKTITKKVKDTLRYNKIEYTGYTIMILCKNVMLMYNCYMIMIIDINKL